MKVDKSRELYERSKKSMAGGVGSSVRMSERPVPLFFKSAKGSHMYDVDGNDYIDYVLGQGPDVLGHSPDFLLEAVARGMQDGQILSGQHEVEISVSEMVQKIVPSAELVRYANSGTEVVQAALRVARAYTGRKQVHQVRGAVPRLDGQRILQPRAVAGRRRRLRFPNGCSVQHGYGSGNSRRSGCSSLEQHRSAAKCPRPTP